MRVTSLHASPHRGMPRPPVERLELVAGHGARGDRKAGRREGRALLLVGQNTYDHLREAGMPLPPGSLGENLVLDADPHALAPGTRLRAGAAELEIALYCTACKTLRDRYGEDFPRLLGRRRGMLARVIRGGTVQSGDAVEVIAGPG